MSMNQSHKRSFIAVLIFIGFLLFMALRIGIDLGGTKTEIAALDSETGEIFLKNRKPTPKDYQGVLDVVKLKIW